MAVAVVAVGGLEPAARTEPSMGASPAVAFVDPVLAKAMDGMAQKAILVLDPAREEAVLAELRDEGIAFRHYDLLHQAAIWVEKDEVEEIALLEGVRGIWANEIMYPYLDDTAPYVGANVLWDTYRVNGTGVGVMIVDSGIDGSHPDVRYGENLVANAVPTRSSTALLGGYQENVPASDVDGHGTHVAAIVAGTAKASGSMDPEYGKYKGIAHGVHLIGFQAGVSSEDGQTQFESVTVLEAFNYALSKKTIYDIRVVSNSWGISGEFDPASPIQQASLNLYKAGLVVTFAAGNEGEQGTGTLNKYCVAPWVLCVAAGDRLNERAPFSSMGTNPEISGLAYDHPDIMAPGIGIISARASSGTATGLPLVTGEALYTTKSGTSMATPVVSGVAALLLSAKPELSPDDVYDILVGSATPVDLPVWDAGAGMVNALEAYLLAGEVPGGLATFLTGKAKYGGAATGDPDYSEDPLSVGLGQGYAKAFSGSDVTPQEFVTSLVGTPQGLVFLAGAGALTLLAFGKRRW